MSEETIRKEVEYLFTTTDGAEEIFNSIRGSKSFTKLSDNTSHVRIVAELPKQQVGFFAKEVKKFDKAFVEAEDVPYTEEQLKISAMDPHELPKGVKPIKIQPEVWDNKTPFLVKKI